MKTLLLYGLFILASVQPLLADAKTEYQTIEWVQLMPADDLEALMNPPEALLNVADGSEMDTLDNLNSLGADDPNAERFYQALKSAEVVEAFNEKSIRLPGFVVPLAIDENNLVTEFFIVPYFGACLHLPPPPPNQIIFAKVTEGFELDSLYNPFWFEGQLMIEQNENDLGTSAYTLKLDSLYLYEE